MSQTSNASVFESLMGRMRGLNVWVVGDLMLDDYIVGKVERISPEAPVPVVSVAATEQRPGGAANVARQVAALGANAFLAGLVGTDSAGDTLQKLCASQAVNTQAVVPLTQRCTTRKLRILGGDQQLVRIDWEDTSSTAPTVERELLAQLRSCPSPDIVIVSDYAKGVVTPSLVGELRHLAGDSVSLVIDPKRRDFGAYRGADILTPNLNELSLACGRALSADDVPAISEAARALATETGIGAMLVTLGANGMLVVPQDAPTLILPSMRQSVFDVTGAGDTAIAVLAMAVGAGGTLESAARLANIAAGLSVTQLGTVAVQAASILHGAFEQRAMKIMSLPDIAANAARWRMDSKKIVFANGCFDLLHAGHLDLLHRAACLGDMLIVAINSDASVKRLKGANRPLVPQSERAAMLAALSCVDAVVILDDDTPIEAILAIRPQVLVKGQDYRLDEVVGREIVESTGGHVVLVPLVPNKSTTKLMKRVQELCD